MNMINDFWNGKIKLWKSYWIVGELLNALFILLIFNIEVRFLNNRIIENFLPFFNFNDFSFFSKILLILWTIFITVGVWRSAENYKGNMIWIVLTLIFLSYRIFYSRIKSFFKVFCHTYIEYKLLFMIGNGPKINSRAAYFWKIFKVSPAICI